MKIANIGKWKVAQAGGTGSAALPAGGYVIRITNVEDVPSREYVNLTFDIAEGEHMGHYADDWGMKNEWAHQFVLSYKETAYGILKGFLKALDESNPSFNAEAWEGTMDERAFIGKVIGAAWGTERYTYDGKDRERKTMPWWYPADKIRRGDFKCPSDVDNREKEPTKTVVTTGGDIYENVPF